MVAGLGFLLYILGARTGGWEVNIELLSLLYQCVLDMDHRGRKLVSVAPSAYPTPPILRHSLQDLAPQMMAVAL